MTAQVVIPAGGLGTRLAGLPPGTPKLLAPVAGRPFLAWQLAALRGQGVARVHLCLGHLHERVLAALPAVTPDGMTVTHTVEAAPLGVVGALRLAAPGLDRLVLVLYGDVYPPAAVAALAARHTDAGAVATMLVADGTDERNVALDGDRITVYSKEPGAGVTHVDIGLTVLDTAELVRRCRPGEPAGEQDLYAPLARTGGLAALRWPVPSLHIGDRGHLAELDRRLTAEPADPYRAPAVP